MPDPIPFTNSFAGLPDKFFTRLAPTAVCDPKLVAINAPLANALNISPAWLKSAEALQTFAGNHIPEGAAPLAQVYAGHQFGGWNPQLGDGRAILLGDLLDRQNIRRDIQLKGSGRTPYSRGGDGRAWLGPVLREYVVSEAMHALGVPTTRALAAVTTGETVQRETALPGAILTRVAASHIRVGTFQYFAARQDKEALETLAEYVIRRHYPDAKSPLELLDAVIAKQASLIAKWMSVGFIHGVMNTDNMAISGETIDYGPCAFMDNYDPKTVFSSIDQFSRYAYAQQPEIAAWNLAQFASCLLPLMGDADKAVQAATAAVRRFAALYAQEWCTIFGRKIGLGHAVDADRPLIEGLLSGLAKSGSDFTNSFRALLGREVPRSLQGWRTDWQTRLSREAGDVEATLAGANPAYIARNHRVEAMIQAAVAGNLGPFNELRELLSNPYDEQPGMARYRDPPKPDEVVQQTFCGT